MDISSGVHVLGGPGVQGSYLLMLHLRRHLRLRYRRSASGVSTPFPAGTHVYVGSAMGRKGAPLARRLLRHATRSGRRPAHAIRAQLLRRLITAAMGNQDMLPTTKTRHWHIDYLLDASGVVLQGIVILRSAVRLETELATMLAADPDTRIWVPGFGASDDPGRTHLFQIDTAAAGCWGEALYTRLQGLLTGS